MDRQQALAYYDDFIECKCERASDEVRKSCKEYEDAFNKYIEAMQEDMFQQAFRYGYEQGLKAARTA